MNLIEKSLAAAMLSGALALPAFGQGFSSGSNGSYGAINITENTTLDMPPDGIFHCTTITVADNRTLSFRKNPNNTPVYLLATGEVRIDGTIDIEGQGGNLVVGGQGGPGGFDGGNPGSVSTSPGAGYGPGAGKGGAHANSSAPDAAGSGSYSTVGPADSSNKGAVYGSPLLLPLVGGSGGGGTIGTPGLGGGGGGGAILIASDVSIALTGTIDADGGGNGSGIANGGSGGAIRLAAPVVSGNGILRANGTSSGGDGRIRVDTLDRSRLAFNFSPSGVTSVGSMMVVFPSPNPRLDIVEAAGTAIPEGSGPVFVQLPFGSSPNRGIILQARDFNDVVPITLVLTPDNGTPVSYEAEIDNRTANPARTTVNVTLPVNVQVSVNAWTR